MGNANAAVFPVPVGELATTSLPVKSNYQHPLIAHQMYLEAERVLPVLVLELVP